MRIRTSLTVFALLAGILVATLGSRGSVSAGTQGTDGTEMRIMEAEQLEVQLGKEWAGKEFQLKTDAGLYPGTIMVGEDGVLRTELGGSTHYTLTCIFNGNPDDTEQAFATGDDALKNAAGGQTQEGEIESQSGETASGGMEIKVQQTAPADPSTGSAVKEDGTEKTVAGIPTKHLVIFSTGMLGAVGVLIALHIVQKRREEEDGYDEDDYDEEDE